jgi:hypothetical protein
MRETGRIFAHNVNIGEEYLGKEKWDVFLVWWCIMVENVYCDFNRGISDPVCMCADCVPV